jgi:hypothetical protein
MQYQPLRLDDVARSVVHYAPEVLFELFSPIHAGTTAPWYDWVPGAVDPWSSHSSRTQIRRLDTQLSPSRWLPDVAYACVAMAIHELWGAELQGRARRSRPARASTCLTHLIRQAFPLLPAGDIEVRSIELRFRQTPRAAASSDESEPYNDVAWRPAERASHGERYTTGLLQFEASGALFELDPNDPTFAHPRCWALVCLSPNVTADEMLQRVARLAELQSQYRIAFPEVRLLLGQIGRARFPDDRRFVSLLEYAVTEAASHPAFDLGYMTEQERQQILLDADDRQRRLHEERLKAAEEEGELRGELRGKLLGALDIARVLLARSMSPDDLEQTMSRLSQMATVEEIQAALSELAGEHS